LASTADSLKLMSRCCRISVSGISSLPASVRSLKRKRRRNWNSRTWPAALRLSTTFSRWSPSTSRITCAVDPARVGDHLHLAGGLQRRLSSTPSGELSPREEYSVVKAKLGALRSAKPHPPG
jgi:hypothetical protein